MFVYSVKSSKIKMVILVLLVVLLVLAMLLVTRLHQPAEADSVLNIKAENAEQRVAFLSQFGWSFDEDPVEVAEVIIRRNLTRFMKNTMRSKRNRAST